MPEKKARVQLYFWPVEKVENVRLVFRCLQAVQELHALGRRRLDRLRVRIRFGLRARIPLSASLSIVSTMRSSLHRLASSAVGVVLRRHGGADGGECRATRRTQSSRSIQEPPASRPSPLARL
jgi:hypothetical protein